MTYATGQQSEVRIRYLRNQALTRERCNQALADGYVIDPDYAEHAANELLLRSIFPFRQPKLTDRILPVDDEEVGFLALLEPIERWAQVSGA
ncbi:hypothetical protein [Microbacterium sp.]|uniref:hypothetical protein n=1 Tax=Microbacterium sp. TaxID=51671 RepID=UPI002C4B8A5E|nr:hypothetical protein [Microbacterium sp.]HWL78061.1 hypothetical protein [Microbacterium sp.]